MIRRKNKPNLSQGIKEFHVLDLFCGAGGLSWGLHKNPFFKTTVALDNDEKAATTFKRNIPFHFQQNDLQCTPVHRK